MLTDYLKFLIIKIRIEKVTIPIPFFIYIAFEALEAIEDLSVLVQPFIKNINILGLISILRSMLIEIVRKNDEDLVNVEAGDKFSMRMYIR